MANSARRAPSWSKLGRLGVYQDHEDPDYLRPELADVGIDKVHRVCDRAWMYSRADFEPSVDVPLGRSQWRETCALAGSMAESLMLSAAAYIEAEWHGRAIAAGTERQGMAIGQRYLADTAADTVISVGHRLINFVARVARTDLETSEKLYSTKPFTMLGPSYVPFETESFRAWLSLNKDTVKALGQTLPPLHSESIAVLNRLVSSAEWIEVQQIRSENFHRWRKEHESVEGVDAQSGTAIDHYDPDGNRTRSVGGFPRQHTISAGMTERTTAAAGAGVKIVAAALDDIITDTLHVLPIITNGYTVELSATRNSKGWRPPP